MVQEATKIDMTGTFTPIVFCFAAAVSLLFQVIVLTDYLGNTIVSEGLLLVCN